MCSCICGEKTVGYGICSECLDLLRASKCKNIAVIEKLRSDYNQRHNTYKTYGQFVAFIDMVARRKKSIDNTRKKASIKKVRTNR